MFCNACGSQNDADCRFCINCGNKLDAVSSANPVTAPVVNPVSAGKVCPRCNERCDTDELFCPRCGFTFQLRSGNEKTVASERESANTFAKICRVYSIIAMCFWSLYYIFATFGVPVVVRSMENVIGYNFYNSNELIAGMLCQIVPSGVAMFLIAVGLIIGKSNIVPGIGYAVLALSGFMPVIFEGSGFLVFSVLFFVMNGLLSALFFVKDGFLKKLWFVPFILMFFCYASMALPVMKIMMPIIEGVVDPDYFLVSNVGTMFVFGFVTINVVISLFTVLPVGYAAKCLWVPEKKSQNTAVQNYIDNIY